MQQHLAGWPAQAAPDAPTRAASRAAVPAPGARPQVGASLICSVF